MNSPSLLIEFDAETRAPAVYLNGATDTETARLKRFADRMLEAIKREQPCRMLNMTGKQQ